MTSVDWNPVILSFASQRWKLNLSQEHFAHEGTPFKKKQTESFTTSSPLHSPKSLTLPAFFSLKAAESPKQGSLLSCIRCQEEEFGVPPQPLPRPNSPLAAHRQKTSCGAAASWHSCSQRSLWAPSPQAPPAPAAHPRLKPRARESRGAGEELTLLRLSASPGTAPSTPLEGPTPQGAAVPASPTPRAPHGSMTAQAGSPAGTASAAATSVSPAAAAAPLWQFIDLPPRASLGERGSQAGREESGAGGGRWAWPALLTGSRASLFAAAPHGMGGRPREREGASRTKGGRAAGTPRGVGTPGGQRPEAQLAPTPGWWESEGKRNGCTRARPSSCVFVPLL